MNRGKVLVETNSSGSSSETISDDTKTTETAQYAMERSETESTKESESIQDITETYEDMSEYAIVEPETEGDLTSKQKNAVNMLNYIMTITQEINNSKESRLYLESAYSSLINNSDPGLIDTRTQERITNILDTLEQYRMIAEKRERLRYIYEQNRAQALRQAIPDPVGLLSAVSSGNILKSAASVIYMLLMQHQAIKMLLHRQICNIFRMDGNWRMKKHRNCITAEKVHLSIWWIWFERILCRENMR